MSNDIAKTESANVPVWMRKASTGASFGNLDASDLKPPRLKVLAGMSPEVMGGTPGAVPGTFWMTILNKSLGPAVTGTPIILRKSYQVWAPKVPGSEARGPLVSASDGIHWDAPNQKFEIRFPNNPKTYIWKIGKVVTDHGATKWGSSQDDDPKSKPIATLTYDVLWVIDLPNGGKQLCAFTNSRTGITPTQNFASTVRAMGVDAFYQRYRIVTIKKSGPTGDPYFTYEYQHIGNIQNEKEGEAMRGLWEQYSKSGFITDFDEVEEAPAPRSFEPSEKEDIDEIPF